jgi:glycosyltransferase involved in cell wall biosynthesis
VKLRDQTDLTFLFVGGGSGKTEVETYITQHELRNAVSLPYQPLSELAYSLTSADVHIVSLGEQMVGIIHPCKIYGAMAAGKPILYLGPRPSHISDLLDKHGFGTQVTHGDVDGALRTIAEFRAKPKDQLRAMGAEAQQVLGQSLSQKLLCGKLCDAIEKTLGLKEAKPKSEN